MTSETVRLAAAAHDLNHRDPGYLELIRDVKHRLLNVQPGIGEDEWVPYLIGGSGTAALEAMISSCIKSGPALIVANGYYSGRLKDIFDAHKIPYEIMLLDWLKPWNLDVIEGRLFTGGFEAVIGTHNETTTGRLNQIRELGAAASRHGCKALADCMSSFGADPVPAEGLDAICSSANKCLHGIAGVSFVLVRKRLAAEMASYPRHTYYLSLPLYEGDNPRLTPPVPALMALRKALQENSGQPARRARYVELAGRIRHALSEHGLALAVQEERLSCTLTTAALPKGWTFERWSQAHHDAGYMIYGCKGELADRFFQVANMGEISDQDVSGWIDFIGHTLT